MTDSGNNTDDDQVDLTILNVLPVIEFGEIPTRVPINEKVELSATVTDDNGDTLTYQWTVNSSDVTIDNADTLTQVLLRHQRMVSLRLPLQ